MEQHPGEREKRGPKRLQAGTKQVALSWQRPSTRGEGLLRCCRTQTRTIPGSGAGPALPAKGTAKGPL